MTKTLEQKKEWLHALRLGLKDLIQECFDLEKENPDQNMETMNLSIARLAKKIYQLEQEVGQ